MSDDVLTITVSSEALIEAFHQAACNQEIIEISGQRAMVTNPIFTDGDDRDSLTVDIHPLK